MAPKIFTGDVTQHLSRLAQLSLTHEESTHITSQLEETIQYIQNLSELDTSTVDPTSHTSDEHNVFFPDGEPSTTQLSHDDALANAPRVDGGCFVVPRIL